MVSEAETQGFQCHMRFDRAHDVHIEHIPETENAMTIEQNNNLNALLTAWRDHQDNKDRGADIAELFNSRDRLDAVRRETHTNLALAS